MRVLVSWSRSHPFRALTLFLALIVLGVVLQILIGGVGGYLAQMVPQVSAIMLGIAFMQADRR